MLKLYHIIIYLSFCIIGKVSFSQNKNNCIPKSDYYCPYNTDYIVKIVLPFEDTIFTNTSICDSFRYSSFTKLASPKLSNSKNHTIKITKSKFSAYHDQLTIWIDYNKNSLFTLEEKIVLKELVHLSKNKTKVFSFYIPKKISTGIYHMRIMLTAFKDAVRKPNPCIAPRWGETEDYKIAIINK